MAVAYIFSDVLVLQGFRESKREEECASVLNEGGSSRRQLVYGWNESVWCLGRRIPGASHQAIPRSSRLKAVM